MDELDLRNTRARVIRLAIAAAIALGLTVLTTLYIVGTGRGPNADPVGSASVGLLAIGMFVVATGVIHRALVRWSRV